jgi:hypothetical protein
VAAQRGTSDSSHQQMLRLLADVARLSDDTNFFVGEGPARQARATLASLPSNATDANRWTALMLVAEEELRLGNYSAAITQLTRARELIARSREKIDPASLAVTSFRLGVTYMRMGERRTVCSIRQPRAAFFRFAARRFTRDRADRGRPSPRSPTC